MRVVIAEDAALFREGLARLIADRITGFSGQPPPIFTPQGRHHRDIDDSYVKPPGPSLEKR
jgi:hypothetical protein